MFVEATHFTCTGCDQLQPLPMAGSFLGLPLCALCARGLNAVHEACTREGVALQVVDGRTRH